jgi:hypothetical protein
MYAIETSPGNTYFLVFFFFQGGWRGIILHKKCIVCLKKWLIFLQTCKETKDIGALQKGADFVRAFTLGFDVDVSHISSIV